MSQLNFEDPQSPRSRFGRALRLVFGIGSIAVLLAVGSTYAANINLNAGESVEFGQGVAQTASCDSDGLNLIPTTEFVNDIPSSDFFFSGFNLENISENCKDVVFKVKAYSASNPNPTNIHPFGPVSELNFYFDDFGWHALNHVCPSLQGEFSSVSNNRAEISISKCVGPGFRILAGNNALARTIETLKFTLETRKATIASLRFFNPINTNDNLGLYYSEKSIHPAFNSGFFGSWNDNPSQSGKWNFDLDLISDLTIALSLTDTQYENAISGEHINQIASSSGRTSCTYMGNAAPDASFPGSDSIFGSPQEKSEVFHCHITGSDDLTFSKTI